MRKKVRIADKIIGEGEKTFIIAEAGVNHDNDINKGKELVRKAAEAGADAIKFQSYTADTLVTKNAPRYWSQELDTDKGTTQHSTFSVINSLALEDYKELKKYAEEKGIIFLSTPFYLGAVDLLEEVGIPAYKIASGDLTYHQLLRKVAQTGKPIIMSVGASRIEEVEESVKVIESEGNNHIILLHCILSYPCEDENANLEKILALKEKFPNYPIGYSDHTRGIVPPIAAMAMGAALVEKHYTLSRDTNETSPDHRFAVNPEELAKISEAAKIIKLARGKFSEKHYEIEQKAHELARRSIVAERDITAGESITEGMLSCKRAGRGLPPKNLDYFLGKIAKEDIPKDKIINFDLVKDKNE
jgi:N,N'-diacetyllegionaminate synthase